MIILNKKTIINNEYRISHLEIRSQIMMWNKKTFIYIIDIFFNEIKYVEFSIIIIGIERSILKIEYKM